MADQRRLAVHHLGRPHDLAAEDLADALVAEAHAEHGPRRRSGDHLVGDARRPRAPRTGQISTRVGVEVEVSSRVECVAAVHDRVGAQLAQVLDEVVDETSRSCRARAHGPWRRQRSGRHRPPDGRCEVDARRSYRSAESPAGRDGRKRPARRRVARRSRHADGGDHRARDAAASSRYTPPVPISARQSPPWVPIIMFTFFGLGMLVIFLHYVELLPGASATGGSSPAWVILAASSPPPSTADAPRGADPEVAWPGVDDRMRRRSYSDVTLPSSSTPCGNCGRVAKVPIGLLDRGDELACPRGSAWAGRAPRWARPSSAPRCRRCRSGTRSSPCAARRPAAARAWAGQAAQHGDAEAQDHVGRRSRPRASGTWGIRPPGGRDAEDDGTDHHGMLQLEPGHRRQPTTGQNAFWLANCPPADDGVAPARTAGDARLSPGVR